MNVFLYRPRIVVLIILISSHFSFAKDKWNTNIYESSTSNKRLDVTGGTEEEINNRVQNVIKGKEKWCDAFIKSCPGKLRGVFAFKGKQRVGGIGYDVSAVKARKKANGNNLAAFDDAGLNKFGMYVTVLKVKTKNGYYIFAILRSPVSGGFNFDDFEDKSDDILKGIEDEG